jgi:hypothetical protein
MVLSKKQQMATDMVRLRNECYNRSKASAGWKLWSKCLPLLNYFSKVSKGKVAFKPKKEAKIA